MKLFRRIFETPVGPMLALASDAALCALEFARPGDTSRMTRLDARLKRWFAPHDIEDGTSQVLDLTDAWLRAYFAGSSFRGAIDAPGKEDIRLQMRGGVFELRVWAALRAIPYGETTTYGEIARRLGSAGASRAVGLANGANPIAIIVPCHRVIGSNGTLTGYGGGLDRKRWLLDHEQRNLALPLSF
jgi:O-6-methylguanine DNA methyltransferase